MFLLSASRMFAFPFRIAYQASHKKMALRSRKKMKKIPMSETKLKELKNIKSQKQLQQESQIKQRLEHKTDINRHSKEIVEELFFPDIKYSSPEVLNKSFTLEQDIKFQGSLQKQLRNKLNSQLLQVYARSSSQFDSSHFYKLFSQFKYNCKNIAQIKQRFLDKWVKYQQVLKRKGNYEPTPFPYRFIDSKDIISHPEWKQIITQLVEKSKEVDEKRIITYFNICHLIKQTFGNVPNVLFQTIINRGFQLQKQNKLTTVPSIELLKLCLLKPFVKLQKRVILQEQIKFKNVYVERLNTLLFNLSNSKGLKADGVVAIIQIFNISSQIKDKRKVLTRLFRNYFKHLTSLSFKSTLEALILFTQNNLLDNQCINLIKFDLFRKVSSAELTDIFKLIDLLQNGEIKGSNVQSNQLLDSVNLRIIQSLKQHKLSSVQLISLLKKNYNNGYQNSAVYNLISNEIVRHSLDILFEDYVDVFCLLTIQGVKSVFLRDSAFERVIKQVKNLRKTYKQQQPKLLPILGNKKEKTTSINLGPNPQEIRLNQQMIKFLWAYLRQSDNNININAILHNFPSIDYVATEPILKQMVQYINRRLKQYSLFPELKSGPSKNQKYPNINYLYKYKKSQSRKLLELQIKLFEEAQKRKGKDYHQPKIQQKWSIQGISESQYLKWLSKSQNHQTFFSVLEPDSELLKNLIAAKQVYKQKRGSTSKEPVIPVDTETAIDYYQLSEQQEENI